MDEKNLNIDAPEVDETPVDEPVDETPVDDKVDDTPIDDKPEDDTPVDDEPSEDEYTEDFDEWRQEQDLPDHIDNVEKLAADRNQIQSELKRTQSAVHRIEDSLRAQGYTNIEDFIRRQPVQTQPASQPVRGQETQGPLLPSAAVDDAIRRGTINSEYAEDYRAQARTYDTVVQQVYQTMGEMFRYFEPLMDQTSVLAQRTQSQDWLRFSQTNKGFERKEVEEYQTKHNFDTLDQAAAAMMASDPKRFADLQKKMETKAEKKARKKLRMTKGLRGQKVRDRSSKGKPDWKVYVQDGRLNSVKLDTARDTGKISDKEHGQICDLYMESQEV